MNKISILTETTENYFDNTVLETTDTIFQEIIKAFPIASDIYRGNDELKYFFENIYQNKYQKS